MDADDPLAVALVDWQRKHRIADDDPMIAAMELARIYVQHAVRTDAMDAQIPSFENFRGTIELLDRRSKSFMGQASDLVAELRRFGQNLQRLNRARWFTLLLLVLLSGAAGALICRLL